jgi:hypothetical protein
VTLPQKERDEMRERRNANRNQLKEGLQKAGIQAPLFFKSQGSYAMKIMTQRPDEDYDIDDGVYFAKEDLVGPRGREATALEARQLMCDALDEGGFNKRSEVRENCVRVYYNSGYRVDMQIYRRVVDYRWHRARVQYELASSDWKGSDARDVTRWFNSENAGRSPDFTNGGQLRRITRVIKKFARSRTSWRSQILSGFGITRLVVECFRKDAAREDAALYNTMRAIRDRLSVSLAVSHPVTPDEMITIGRNDPTAKYLRDRLTDAMDWLAPQFETACSREKALSSWDKVFATKYFSKRR